MLLILLYSWLPLTCAMSLDSEIPFSLKEKVDDVNFRWLRFWLPPRLQQVCACSKRPISIRQLNKIRLDQFRVMGGNAATPYNYPEMVMVIYNQMSLCGGTILNQQYILTAAHCAVGTNASLFIVVAGVYDINVIETSRRELRVKRVVIHPGFNRKTYKNDIALLELTETFVFNSHIQPTCLPLRIVSYNGKAGIATGWGKTEPTGSISTNLNEVTMPIVDNLSCQKSFGSHHIYNSMICAGVQQGGKDTCGGDSGGPLFVWSAQHDVLKQVGVTSFGAGCGLPGIPGVYTRTDYMMTFLLQNVHSSGCKFYANE